jgi:hypothetical protein
MKRTLTALAALGFLAVMAGPALAGGGCGGSHLQSVKADPSDRVAQGEQSTPVPTQTASTEEKSE